MKNETSSKKNRISPNQKLLKSLYNKRRSKSQYSPNANRSISKQQINHQMQKIVLKGKNTLEALTDNRNFKNYHGNSILEKSVQKGNIHTSLTPKNILYQKRQSERGVKTSKASQSKGKQFFMSSGQYDLKYFFDRKKGLDQRQKQKQHINILQKNDSPAHQSKCHQEDTVKFNLRNKEQFNVKAYVTAEQYSKFGQRFPENFKRVGLLGRGGFSVVWLGVHRTSKKKVAIKQILTNNPHQTHLKEIWFGSYFFQRGGQARQQFENHIGINNICRLYTHEIHSIDSWLYYQICDQSLGSSLFELKGQISNGQRFYKIEYKDLIYRIKYNPVQLETIIIEVSKALFLINSHNIVHSDLKTENILLGTLRKEQLRQGKNWIKRVKLIDFGSSFLFTNLKQFSMATPQYMPPQILNYILYQNKLEYDEQMLTKMSKYKNPWVIDVWSLGCIILQIVSGIPLWMSIQTRIEDRNERVTGLFAIKNRVFSKIIQKQIQIINNLDHCLYNNNYSGIRVSEKIRGALKLMLHLQPQKRISPLQILNHFGIKCQPEKIPSY